MKLKRLESADIITISESTWKKVEKLFSKYSWEQLYEKLSILLGRKVTEKNTIVISKNVEVLPAERLKAEQQLEMWLINEEQFNKLVYHREYLKKRKINKKALMKVVSPEKYEKIAAATEEDRTTIFKWFFKRTKTLEVLVKKLKEKYRKMFNEKEQDKSLLELNRREAEKQLIEITKRKNVYKWLSIVFALISLAIWYVHFL